MTKERIEAVLERVRKWPAKRQADAVRLLEMMEQSGTRSHRLSDEEREAVLEGLAEARRGEFLSDDGLREFWNRNRS